MAEQRVQQAGSVQKLTGRQTRQIGQVERGKPQAGVECKVSTRKLLFKRLRLAL